MKKAFSNLLRIISILCLFVVVVFGIMLASGLRPFILESPSMEPLFKPGSLIVVDTRTTPTEINTGDVIVYRAANDMLVMHRYVGSDEEGLALIQGDRNRTQEHINLTTAFVGKEVFQIAGIGGIAKTINASPWIAWSLVIGLIVLACIPSPDNHRIERNPQ